MPGIMKALWVLFLTEVGAPSSSSGGSPTPPVWQPVICDVSAVADSPDRDVHDEVRERNSAYGNITQTPVTDSSEDDLQTDLSWSDEEEWTDSEEEAVCAAAQEDEGSRALEPDTKPVPGQHLRHGSQPDRDSDAESDPGWSDDEDWKDAVEEAVLAAQEEGAQSHMPQPEVQTIAFPEQPTTFTHYGLEVTLKEVVEDADPFENIDNAPHQLDDGHHAGPAFTATRQRRAAADTGAHPSQKPSPDPTPNPSPGTGASAGEDDQPPREASVEETNPIMAKLLDNEIADANDECDPEINLRWSDEEDWTNEKGEAAWAAEMDAARSRFAPSPPPPAPPAPPGYNAAEQAIFMMGAPLAEDTATGNQQGDARGAALLETDPLMATFLAEQSDDGGLEDFSDDGAASGLDLSVIDDDEDDNNDPELDQPLPKMPFEVDPNEKEDFNFVIREIDTPRAKDIDDNEHGDDRNIINKPKVEQSLPEAGCKLDADQEDLHFVEEVRKKPLVTAPRVEEVSESEDTDSEVDEDLVATTARSAALAQGATGFEAAVAAGNAVAALRAARRARGWIWAGLP